MEELINFIKYQSIIDNKSDLDPKIIAKLVLEKMEKLAFDSQARTNIVLEGLFELESNKLIRDKNKTIFTSNIFEL